MAKTPSSRLDEVQNLPASATGVRGQDAALKPSVKVQAQKGMPTKAPMPPKNVLLNREEEEQALQAAEEDLAAEATAEAVPVESSEVLLAQASGATGAAVIPSGSSAAAGAAIPTAGTGAATAGAAGAAGATGISWGMVAAGVGGAAALASGGGSSGSAVPPSPPPPAPPPAPVPEPEPVQTVHQLTTNIDNVKGGDGTDLIIGSSTTFQPSDVVDGGAGKDTLQLQLNGGSYGDGAIVRNVEVLDLRALAGEGGAVNLYMTDWDNKLTTVNVIEAKQDVALRDQQTLADVNINKSGKSVELSYESHVTDGDADELKVSVNAYTGMLSVDDRVESLRLSVDDAAGDINASDMSVNALSSTTIVGGRAGQGFGLTLVGEDAGASGSLDASAFGGDLTLNAGSHLKNVKTGAGNDTVTVSGGSDQADATYELGEGNNTLIATGRLAGSVTAGAGSDVLLVKGVEGKASVDLGDGDNQLQVGEDGITGEASLVLGDGHNIAQVGGSVEGATGEDASGISITFGDGDNQMEVMRDVANATIAFGDGGNLLDIGGALGSSSLSFGDGTNILETGEDVAQSTISFGDGSGNVLYVGNDLEGSTVSFGDGSDNVLMVEDDIEGSTISFGDGNGNQMVVEDDVEASTIGFGNGNGNALVVEEDVESSAISFGSGEGNELVVGGDLNNSTVSFGGGSVEMVVGGQVASSGDGAASVSFSGNGNVLAVNVDGDGEDGSWAGIQGHVRTTLVGEDVLQEEVRAEITFGAGDDNALYVTNGSVKLADISFGAGSGNVAMIQRHLKDSNITFGGEDATEGTGNGLALGGDIKDSRVVFHGAASLLQVGDDVRGSQLTFGAGPNRVDIYDDLTEGSSLDIEGGGNRVRIGGDVEDSSITITGGGNQGSMGEDESDAGIYIGGDVENSNINVVGGDSYLAVGDDVEGSTLSFGAGGNTVEIVGDVKRGSTIELAGSDSTVSIGGDLDNSTVSLGDGGNTVNVVKDLDNGALIESNGGTNTVNVGGKVSDGSQITLGDGDDTVTIGVNDHKQGSVGGKGGEKALVDTGAGDDQVTLIGSKHYGNTLVRSGGALEGGEGRDTLTVKAASDVNVVGRTEHQKAVVELADSYSAGELVTLRIGGETYDHLVEYTSAQELSFTFGGEHTYAANQAYSITIGGVDYSFTFPGAQGGPQGAAQAVANGIKAALEADGVTGFGTPNLIDNGDGTYTLSLTGDSDNADNVEASSTHATIVGADGADRSVQTPAEIAEALEALIDSHSDTFSASSPGGKIVLVAKGEDAAADVSISLSLTADGVETQVDGAVTTKQIADAGISGFETIQLEILNSLGEDTDIDAREITADFNFISGVENIVLDSQVKIDAVTVANAGGQDLVNGSYQRMDEYGGECSTDPATTFNLLNLKGDEAITVRGHEVSATGSQQVDHIRIGNQDGDHHVGDLVTVRIGDKTYALTITADDLSGENAQADAEAIASRLAELLAEGSGESWPFSVAVDGNLITLVGTDPSRSAKVEIHHTRPNAEATELYGSGEDSAASVDFNGVDDIRVGDVIRLQLGEETISYTVVQDDVDACCDRHVADVLAEKVATALISAGHEGARAHFGMLTLGGQSQATWAVTRLESEYVDETDHVERAQKSRDADDSEIDVTVKATLAQDTDNDSLNLTVDGHGSFDLNIVGDGEGQYEHLKLAVADAFSHYIDTNGNEGNFSESITLSGGAVGTTIHLDQVLAGNVSSTSEANIVIAQYDRALENGLVGEDTVVNVSTGSGDDHLITFAPALFSEGSSVNLGTGNNTLSLGWGWQEDCGDAVPKTINGEELARVAGIAGLTQLQRLNLLNAVELTGDTALAMMETTVANTVEAIDLWDLTVAHGEDADLTISGTASSLLLEASHGNLDLGSEGVLTVNGVTDLRVHVLDDATFALGNDTLNSLSVVSEDYEASVYLRDGADRTVNIGSVELEGRGDDAKLTILNNTGGAVTVGSVSAKADAEARLAIDGNTNTDISVGGSGGINLLGGEDAAVSISGNGDNKLEADQLITLGDLSLRAGEDASVAIESNTANTITLGTVDMVACDDDASFTIKKNVGIDYQEGVSASVDWASISTGAIRMDAGDQASFRVEDNTWAEVDLGLGDGEGVSIKARDDIEFKIRDNTNVSLAVGDVALSSADRISASISDNETDVADEDGFVSSISVGDFLATANRDVSLKVHDNEDVKVTLGDVALTSYEDDVVLSVKDNVGGGLDLGAITLVADDDASLFIRSNKAEHGRGAVSGENMVSMTVDGDIAITSNTDDASFSFSKNRGVQLAVSGNVSLKGEDDVRFNLSDNKSSLVMLLGSGESVGEDSQVSAAIRLESTDGGVSLSIEDNGSRHGGFFGALLGTVDIDAADDAIVKINDNRGSVVAIGLAADTDSSTLLAPLMSSGSILEGMAYTRDSYLGEGSSIDIDATNVRFEIEDNRAVSGEDSLFDFNVVAMGALNMNASDAAIGEDGAQATATMAILDNRDTLVVTGDLSLSSTASSEEHEAEAITALHIGDTGFFSQEQNCDAQGNEQLALVTGDIVLNSEATAAGEARSMAALELSDTEDFLIQFGDVKLHSSATSAHASAYASAGMAVIDNVGGEDSLLEMGDVTITATSNPVGEDMGIMSVPSNGSYTRAAFTFMENRDMTVKTGDVSVSATASGGEDSEAFAAFHLDENTAVSFEFGDVSVSASAVTGRDFAGFSIVDQDEVSVKVGDVKVSTAGVYGLAGVAVGAYSNAAYGMLTNAYQGEDNFEMGTRYEPTETDANDDTDVSLGDVTVDAGNDAAVWLTAGSHGSLTVGDINVTSAMAAGAQSGDIFFYMDDVTAGEADSNGITIVLDGSGGEINTELDNTVYATLNDTPDVHSLTIKGANANVFLEGEMDGFATLDLSGVTDFAYVETWDADFSNGDNDLKLSDHIVVKIGGGNVQYNAMYGIYNNGGETVREYSHGRVQVSGEESFEHGDWNDKSGWYSLGGGADSYLDPMPHEIYIETWDAPTGERQDAYKFTVDGTSYSVSIERYWAGEDSHGEDTYDYRLTDFRIGLSDEDVGQSAFEDALGLSSFEWVGDRFVLTGQSDGSALKPVTTATKVVADNQTVNHPMEVENVPGHVASDGIGNAVQEVFQFVGDSIGEIVIGGFFAKPVGADNVDGVLRWGDRLDFSQFDLNGAADGMGGRNDLTISVVNTDGGYFSDVLITFNTAGMEDSSILLVGVGAQYGTPSDVITNVTNSIIFA